MTTYAGFYVLEIEPSRDARDDGFTRSTEWMDGKTGLIRIDARDREPKVIRSFKWMAFTRTEIDALRAFIDARKGRAVPFWCPTWDADLMLANNIGPSDNTITIHKSGYTQHLFPHLARRRLALTSRDGAWYYRKVTAAVDNGNGTETLTLDATLGVSITTATALISFLPMYRLNNDAVEIYWHSTTIAECQLQMMEIPTEVPA